MATQSAAVLAAGLMTCSLVGCGDPLVGHWRAVDDNSCGYSAFTVDDDLRGSGTLYLFMPDCQACSFAVSADDIGDEKYVGTVTLDTCACPDGANRASAVCKLQEDEEYVDCHLSMSCYDDAQTFRKEGD